MQETAAAHAPQAGPAVFRWYTALCAGLARASLMLAVALLIGVIVCVQWQVIGRYVFNDTPTWAEALALLLVLYMTSLGVAVGVRDAGHIGLESLATLLPLSWQRWLAMVVHLLVATFGVLMAKSGWLWATGKWNEKKPMLGVPEGADYVPLVVAGILIVLFCTEHIIALLRGHEVAPAWN
ncbi:TRAP transporter small permease [Ramlibacter sp. WS9]|uniref:TRAP transporter small permease n=1 Tax=Ramlibacter sp. WS9 TaxID=1882741 RepID=UPI001144FED1|nr:TRAP transporter small permease [Ramlibacter sp. WS9]ROZ62729.1 TRAP transporter small permease [Ramlibacter sp. WS9]